MTQTHERNVRLAEAMARAGLTSADLAEAAGVDPRTIDRLVAHRWRTPRAPTRHQIAESVHVPVGVLWPDAANGPQVTDELIAIYPSRAAIPPGLVMSLLGTAQRQVDVLALAAVWLWDAVPGFAPAMASKARAGIDVRVCLGDPSGESARMRGAEEGIDQLLAARCQLAAAYAKPLVAANPASVRLHDTTLYASILRFDNDLLVNWHLYGAPAAESPTLHLRHTSGHGLAATVARSFERVWEGAQPLAG